MAQLNSRGTLTRSRWDYYESSDAWAMIQAQVPSGQIGCYLANNSTGSTALDVYSLNFTASLATTWWAIVMSPPIIVSPVAPIATGQSPAQVDRGALPGVLGAYSAISSSYIRIANWAAPVTNILLNPLGNMFWVSLPPGWAISAYADGGTGTEIISMTVWYQEVLDNIAPAL